MNRRCVIKRVLDIVASLLLLPLWLPVLTVCAILVKATSVGPAFFRQERTGLHRKPFWVIKLRTMVVNAERMGAGLYTEKDDPRFTPLGLRLRRFSLDELPQFLNVLVGDMSIIGPRPLPAVIVDQYPAEFSAILRVKPGITGLSQVLGRNELPRSERLRLDKYYAEHWSFVLDMKIVWKTVHVVFAGKG